MIECYISVKFRGLLPYIKEVLGGITGMGKNELLLAFYGDDFTGSTDAMEALASNGYRTVLFTEVPTLDLMKRFEGVDCIGIAGTSRAKTPEDMECELRPVYQRLAELNTPIVHYKICSTFDSSPEIGNIGRAIEIAYDYFGRDSTIPLLAGAPLIGRYTVFGDHYAAVGETVYRLDQHPVMSRHPVTPMKEANLKKHLQEQLTARIENMNILELNGTPLEVKERFHNHLTKNPDILLFDVVSDANLQTIGELIWESDEARSTFVVGSSGVEYALTSHWNKSKRISSGKASLENEVAAVNQILVVSGSCSPITEQQIKVAIDHGFMAIKISPEAIASQGNLPDSLIEESIQYLKNGKSVLLYTAMGPDDLSISDTREQLDKIGITKEQSGEFIGKRLGRLTNEVVKRSNLPLVSLQKN
jgi:uncharacterized protein YgbK (DUF1537 family)